MNDAQFTALRILQFVDLSAKVHTQSEVWDVGCTNRRRPRCGLFGSIGSCTSSVQDAPAGVRGSVHSIQAGQGVFSNDDLGPGWQHLTALRQGGELRLDVNGRLTAKSAPFDSEEYALTGDGPLKIGSGEHDFFTGSIREVQLYRLARG